MMEENKRYAFLKKDLEEAKSFELKLEEVE